MKYRWKLLRLVSTFLSHKYMQLINEQCHTFLAEPAKRSRIAIDCGGNNGEFTKWLRTNTEALIYCFEPDPRLFGKLPTLSNVEYIQKAVDGTCGTMKLAIGENNCSSGFYRERDGQTTIEVEKISLDEFCRQREIESIDLLKLDVEGAELNILEQMSGSLLQNTTQITVEFHDFLNRADIPRIKLIFKRLRMLGFVCYRFSHYTWGDCCFVNQSRVQIGHVDNFRILVMYKYLEGMKRIVGRLIG